MDALVTRLADPAADPVLRRASAAQMRSRLAGPAPEQPGDYGAVLEGVLADVLPSASRTELEVIDRFRTRLGLPDNAAGVLVTGGSAANLTALLVARDAACGPSGDEVVSVSDQAHSSLARTARAMGLRPTRCGCCPPTEAGGCGPAR